MRLSFCVHPVTRVVYTFPRMQDRLSVTNARKNPVFIVPGGGGPVNPKGSAPFDRDVNTISYQFRVAPQTAKQTFTQARDAFLAAVDHGLPQTLGFLDDDGKTWLMQAALLRDPLQRDTNAPYAADFQVDWVPLSDLLASNAAPGAVLFGHTFKYGHNKKYGASNPSYSLTANPVAINLDNSATGATGATTDPVFSFTGPYGPAAPSGNNVLYVFCLESNTTFWLSLNLLAGETLLVDLAARRVLKNGQPIFGLLARTPGQRTYISLMPGVVNHLSVGFNGAALPTLAGSVTIKWKPKKGF